MDSTLIEKVQSFAAQAHEGQRRKFADEPYSNHLVRVMQACNKVSSDEVLLSAALLHDVLEDTAVEEEDMRSFLSEIFAQGDTIRVVELVKELTDVYTPSAYPSWNRRKRKKMESERLKHISADGQTIKYADIIDNSTDIANIEYGFAVQYMSEYMTLLELLNKGNSMLYREAIETVTQSLQQIQNSVNQV